MEGLGVIRIPDDNRRQIEVSGNRFTDCDPFRPLEHETLDLAYKPLESSAWDVPVVDNNPRLMQTDQRPCGLEADIAVKDYIRIFHKPIQYPWRRPPYDDKREVVRFSSFRRLCDHRHLMPRPDELARQYERNGLKAANTWMEGKGGEEDLQYSCLNDRL